MNVGRLLSDRRALWAAAAVLLIAALLGMAGGAAKGTVSTQEKRIAAVLSAMEGAGKVEVALFYGGEGTQPTGAVVVAQGAGDLAVRLRLIRAARTLLGLPETAVDVFEMEEKR